MMVSVQSELSQLIDNSAAENGQCTIRNVPMTDNSVDDNSVDDGICTIKTVSDDLKRCM